MTYEIIGAGGGGGAGDGSPGLGGTVKRLLFASTTQGQAARWQSLPVALAW